MTVPFQACLSAQAHVYFFNTNRDTLSFIRQQLVTVQVCAPPVQNKVFELPFSYTGYQPRLVSPVCSAT